jgi:hypothetical protein
MVNGYITVGVTLKNEVSIVASLVEKPLHLMPVCLLPVAAIVPLHEE